MMVKSSTHKKRGRKRALDPDRKTSIAKWDKPFDKWTKKEREELDELYRRFFSPRGAKPNQKYDALFGERVRALELRELVKKYPGLVSKSAESDVNKVPSYTELASRAVGHAVSSDEFDKERDRFIRAYRRRKNKTPTPHPHKK